MPSNHPLPNIWLVSDERIDNRLDWVLEQSGVRLGFVFRHYHLPPQERFARFRELATIARRHGHLVILSDSASTAREWGADGIYGDPSKLGKPPDLLRLATAHDGREIFLANRNGAHALFLSPVFPTRSHGGKLGMGPENFRQLAARSEIPVIALGGMNAENAKILDWPRWAGIDAFADGLQK